MFKEISKKIRKYALMNAVKHEGKASVNAVLGKILAENPDLREKARELKSQVEEIVFSVNRLSIEDQKKELGKIDYEVRKEEKALPELYGEVVVRFAPNPDGALHLGNARPAILCDELAKKYNGKFILRFDDTDPKIKVPEKIFYEWIREDLKWLGIKYKKEIIASKRLKIYYKYAEKLIHLGKAYVCTCDVNKWRELRNRSEPCLCRGLSIDEQMKRWQNMKNKYKEGQAVLRIKTDLNHENPAVRDWPAFRIVDKPNHPISKARLWPLFNFASAIDDHLLKITHILRGQEHATNEVKQRFIYDYFNWKYPDVMILGRFIMQEMVLSKSKIKEGIKKGVFSGWDDVRLGTLRALKRRGFQAEAIRKLILDIGVKSSDVVIASENLAAYNRKIIDMKANRYFFVPNPVKIKIKNPPIKKTKIALHPSVKRGFRKFIVSDEFFIDREDYKRFKGKEIRLIGLYNVILGKTCKVTSTEIKKIQKIQWVPSNEFINVEIISEGRIKGYGEKNLLKTKIGEIVQLERFGFCCIEKKTKRKIVAVFGHR